MKTSKEILEVLQDTRSTVVVATFLLVVILIATVVFGAWADHNADMLRDEVWKLRQDIVSKNTIEHYYHPEPLHDRYEGPKRRSL